jgi:hypothetical protein
MVRRKWLRGVNFFQLLVMSAYMLLVVVTDAQTGTSTHLLFFSQTNWITLQPWNVRLS